MTRTPLLLSRHKEQREENIRSLQKMKWQILKMLIISRAIKDTG